jgi:hypothetical protein
MPDFFGQCASERADKLWSRKNISTSQGGSHFVPNQMPFSPSDSDNIMIEPGIAFMADLATAKGLDPTAACVVWRFSGRVSTWVPGWSPEKKTNYLQGNIVQTHRD